MPIVSIVLFIFGGALLLYAGLTALIKEIIVPINMSASVKNVSKKYALKFALLIAFLSISAFGGGIVGMFCDIVLIPIIVFFVLFIVLMIVGIKVIMKDADK